MPMPRRTTRLSSRVGAALTLALVLGGCVTPPGGSHGMDAAFETIDQGQYGQGPSQAEQRIIGDREAWGTFWKEHASRTNGIGATGTPPQVDFDDAFVLFVYAGMKPSGGHGVEVSNITFDNTSYQVTITEHAPGEDCFTTQAVTYPYHLVRVTRPAGDDDAGRAPEATFERRVETYPCGTNGSDQVVPPATPTPMLIDTLDEGSYPQGPAAAEHRVIAEDETWGLFWQEHHERKSESDVAATPPDVDFDREFVLFAYAGEKPSGGYMIRIDDV